MGRSFSSWRRCWLVIGIAALLAPTASRAEDAVEILKRTLKEGTFEQARKDVDALDTLSDLRRAFFLSEWPRDLEKKEKDHPEQKKQLLKLRDVVGKKLADRIRASAVGDTDRHIAACIMIAEIAEADQPDQRSPSGKYASQFSDLLLGDKTHKGFVHSSDVRVRQAALHALGKITPNPAEAMPVLRSALKEPELGPRRLAAYALSDLVRNSSFLPRRDESHYDEMTTLNQAVAEAVRVLRLREEDEQVRGYCLQTIQVSARIFTDYRWATKFVAKDELIQFELDNKTKKLVLDPSLQELLQSYQNAMPQFLTLLANGPGPKIKLSALETISQVITSRYELCKELQKKQGKDNPLPRSQLLKEFGTPDPIASLLAGQWAVIPAVLKQTEDIRLKRGVMSLLENVAEDVDATIENKTQEAKITAATIRQFAKAVTPALNDPDRYVRWTAARTLRYISPEYFDDEIVLALGRMLIDQQERDPDLTKAAAMTIESIAQSPFATKAIQSLRTAIADATMDPDNRIAAMKALVAINTKPASRAAANEAFPEVTAAVGAEDVNVRREACLTLGQLGRPRSDEHFRAAINALKAAMRDDDTDIRLNASEAILSITPPR